MSEKNELPEASVSKPKRKKHRWLIDATIILAIFIAINWWQARDTASGPAPALIGETIDGELLDLDQYQGKPVLVHFWATWCAVCKLEEGMVNSIAQDHAVVTVAMQSGSDAEVADHVRSRELNNFTVLNDEKGVLSNRWGVSAVPTSFVIDAKGEIAYTVVGLSTGPTLRARLALVDL